MDSAQLELGLCFSNEEWERGFTLDGFIELLQAKIARPKAARRLAHKRLEQARVSLVDEPVKFGLLTVPLLVGAIAFPPAAVRVILALLWAIITGTVLILNVSGYRYAKRLVERLARAAPEES